MFFIYGNLNFVPGGYNPWIDAYKKLEAYVELNEQDTCLTYYFGIPEEWSKDMSTTPQMLAFEQYRVRSDLYDTHFNSKPMGEFLPAIAPTMATGLDLTHYEDVAGYLDKADKVECGIFYDTRIKCETGKREEVLSKLKILAQVIEKEEKDTYTFLVLKSLDGEGGVRIFERYASKAALQEHWKGKALLNFFKGSKEIISSMEGRGYIPNGHGWLHR